MNERLWTFSGGAIGSFFITDVRVITGEPLPAAKRLRVSRGNVDTAGSAFSLHGVTSNERYVTLEEKQALSRTQQSLGGPTATQGALIPIKKSQAWWDLSQSERRAIFEERSKHIEIGTRALPLVARRLHHCRDLTTDEPFDFLTWFDFRAEDAPVFDDLLASLRSTVEWRYVEREIEIRVQRATDSSSYRPPT